MKWLVTAFAPFGGAESNSSLKVLEALRNDPRWRESCVFYGPVPVEFGQAWPNVKAEIERDAYRGVLCLGEARRRALVSLERVALNWIDTRSPDNGGHIPHNARIQSGPELLWSTIPWEEFPLSAHCERSYSAGTYVCNTLMYQCLAWGQGKQVKAGFVHIPVLNSQTDLVFADQPHVADQVVLHEINRILEFVTKL